MSIQIRRTESVATVKALHTLILPNDDWEAGSAYWVAWDGDTPVGFCSVKRISSENCAYLLRAGVLSVAQGKSLQRRMIRVRERWARDQKMDALLTYCTYDNHSSLVNLLRCNYKLYHPANAWAGRDVHYFMKNIDGETK